MDGVRALLHEFYVEISTSRMSKDRFEEFIVRIIDASFLDRE